MDFDQQTMFVVPGHSRTHIASLAFARLDARSKSSESSSLLLASEDYRRRLTFSSGRRRRRSCGGAEDAPPRTPRRPSAADQTATGKKVVRWWPRDSECQRCAVQQACRVNRGRKGLRYSLRLCYNDRPLGLLCTVAWRLAKGAGCCILAARPCYRTLRCAYRSGAPLCKDKAWLGSRWWMTERK